MEENKSYLLRELDALEQERIDLNYLVDNAGKFDTIDQITFLRFKKRKLFIKDSILKIKSKIHSYTVE